MTLIEYDHGVGSWIIQTLSIPSYLTREMTLIEYDDGVGSWMIRNGVSRIIYTSKLLGNLAPIKQLSSILVHHEFRHWTFTKAQCHCILSFSILGAEFWTASSMNFWRLLRHLRQTYVERFVGDLRQIYCHASWFVILESLEIAGLR